MSNPYGGQPSGPFPQQPYGPPSGPQPQQPYGPPSGPQPYGQPGYGQPVGPIPQHPGYGGAPGYHPAGQLSHWGWRVLGSLVDGGIVTVGYFAIGFIGFLLGGLVYEMSGSDVAASITALVFLGIAYLALFAFGIWNMAYRRGTKGQTIGQQTVGIKTIGEMHGQPIGFGNAFLRQLCHILDGMACSIGYLFPLWDEKRQTFADKIMTTVVVHADQAGPGMPPAGPGQPGAYPQPGQPGGYPQPGTPGGGFQAPGQPQQW